MLEIKCTIRFSRLYFSRLPSLDIPVIDSCHVDFRCGELIARIVNKLLVLSFYPDVEKLWRFNITIELTAENRGHVPQTRGSAWHSKDFFLKDPWHRPMYTPASH